MKNTHVVAKFIEDRNPQGLAQILMFVDIPKYLEPEILMLAIETEHHHLIKMYMSMYTIKNKYQALALLSIANLGNMTYYFIISELNKLYKDKSEHKNTKI